MVVSGSEMKVDQVSGNVAVVGTGHWGKNLVRHFHELGVLRAVCDLDPERLREVERRYPGCRVVDAYSGLLADRAVEAVAIATPAESHAELTKEALLAGKDVFVEKPLCLSLRAGEELVSLAREQERILMVGHLLWYHPAILKLKELVDGGELGRIQYIYSNRLNLGKFRREENILWSFAPHDISVILGLLSEMPESVQSQGGYYLHEQIADVTVSMLAFPSGIRAHIFVSWLHPFKEQKLVVVGDRKMAVFNDLEDENKLALYPHSIQWKNQIPIANQAHPEVVPVERAEPLRAECLHFLESIRTRKRPRTDGEEALTVLTVLHQCQASLEAGAHGRPKSSPEYFVHESASVDEDVQIGKGTRIWHVSHIMKGSKIGDDCSIGQNVVIGPHVEIGDGVKIQNNVSVYEGVTLEDHVFCGPSMVFTNVINPRSEIPRMKQVKPTVAKKGATLGANSTIVCGVTIGRYAFVGAGAVVTKNVSDYALVVGNPARFQAWMCECGVKLEEHGKNLKCIDCKREYRSENGALHAVSNGCAGIPSR